MGMVRARAAVALLLLGCATAATAQNGAPPLAPSSGPALAPDGSIPALTQDSRIDCAAADGQDVPVCRVDTATFVGWRVFAAQCASCHAQDALGSSFAPDLTFRMRGMDAREFMAALDNGYLGPNDASPPRGAMPDVARYYNELWSYLSARASGELPPGSLELERLPSSNVPGR
jgi:mono/diheme cytochrome c family protein